MSANYKILVFTNYDSIFEVIRQRRDLKGIHLIEDSAILGFDEAADCFKDGFTQSRLIFINDELEENDPDLIKLLQDTKEDILLLIHRLPGEAVLNTVKSTYTRSGTHSAAGTGIFYPLLFEIILDSEPDKIQRIKEAIFPAFEVHTHDEKTLALLHDCLHFETAASTDTAWLTEQQQNMVAYLSGQTDNLTDGYIQQLTQLRNSLNS